MFFGSHSQASEMSQMIQSTRDLGCKAPSVVTIEEAHGKPLGSNRDWKRFMEALGGADNIHGKTATTLVLYVKGTRHYWSIIVSNNCLLQFYRAGLYLTFQPMMFALMCHISIAIVVVCNCQSRLQAPPPPLFFFFFFGLGGFLPWGGF